jgi:5-methyltetrahydropteroyltriglutamate--homocysteine methyltransferase
MDVAAYLHGIYPRSEAVVAATRDLDRGRTTSSEVDRAFAEARGDLIDLQLAVGLDYVSDGMLRWQDIFRPLAEAAEGLEPRTLVRWFDNNSFFRAPRVTASPRLDGRAPEIFDEEPPLPSPRAATLPSPYLFSRAVETDGDRDRLLSALARDLLAPAASALADRGYALIHLHEPWLGFHGIAEETWPALEEGIRSIRDAAPDVTLVLHVSYGDAAPHAERLRALPVDAIGFDFVETELDALPVPWGTGLVTGCLDARRSVLETAEGTVGFVRRLAERLDPETLFLTPSSELELLGPEVAERKLRLLGEVAADVKGVAA